MDIHEAPTPPHWNYFLALEDDVVRMSRYLEPTKDNFNSYSLELARILFAASAEVDVVLKHLCKKLNTKSKAKNIDDYQKEVLEKFPQLASTIVNIPRFGLTFTPWSGWKPEKSPIWWQANNKVKHNRHAHFSKASFENALNAVAALFVTLLFYYEDEGKKGQLTPDPAIMRVGSSFRVDQPAFGPTVNIYQLIQSKD